MPSAAPAGSDPLFTVTPPSQSTFVSLLSGPYTIQLLNGAVAGQTYIFQCSMMSPGGGADSYSPASAQPIMNADTTSATFEATHTNAGTYTITIAPPSNLGGGSVTVQLVVTRQPTGFSVTPASQTAQTGTPTGPYTLSLLPAGALAPAGGLAFALATSATGGTFPTGSSATVPAGQSSVTFDYEGSVAETDTLTVTPPSSLSASPQSVQAVITNPPPPPPPITFGILPASQTAITGQQSGPITITLSQAASANLTFGLATDETTGGTISTGNSVTVVAGQTSVSFTYESVTDGTFHLTATPPSGVSGSAQTVSIVSSTPASGGGTGSGSGGTGSGTPATLPVASSAVEVDIRCYNANGTRRAMPPIDELSFELAEQGGMQTGSLQMLAAWEETGWTGTEYIDVWLWGQLLYRGYVRQPQQELGNPERSSPTLHGLMTLLNGYQVRRDFGYTPSVSPSRLFLDIAALCVTRTGRMPALVLDTTGVDALGLTLLGMQCKGKTVPQALNSLCELYPNQLIWGCDVDGQGRNRLYLHPRATSVKYTYVVGGDVAAFVFPRDYTQIVNRLYITGAKFDGSLGTIPAYANLLPNASFEVGAPNNEIDGNVLVNPGFEATDAFGSNDNPWQTGGAFIRTSPVHSGSQSCELNNDDIPQEFVAQDIPIAGPPMGVHAACWWCGQQNLTWTPNIRLELFEGSSLVASTNLPAVTYGPELDGYQFYHLQLDWTPPRNIGCNRLRVSYILSSESATGSPAGQTLVDDCSVWFDGAELAKSWRVSPGHNGAWAGIDWRNRDFTPYDGDVMVRALAQLTGGAGSYAEIATTVADRPQASINTAYHISFRVYNAGTTAIYAASGCRTFNQGAQQGTDTVGPQWACAPGQWTDVQTNVRTGPNCDALEVFFRAYTSNALYYIDAAGLWDGLGSGPPTYLEADTFQATRSVTDYAPAVLGNAAAYSIANYGEREEEVSNDQITNAQDADAYAISYFKALAVPQVQARLSLKEAVTPLGLDGQIRLVNLPDAPDALTPARVTYRIGASIDIEADLNNERPQLEDLLRLVAAGKA